MFSLLSKIFSLFVKLDIEANEISALNRTAQAPLQIFISLAGALAPWLDRGLPGTVENRLFAGSVSFFDTSCALYSFYFYIHGIILSNHSEPNTTHHLYDSLVQYLIIK